MTTKHDQIRAAVKALSDLISMPGEGEFALELLAQSWHQSASELEASWQSPHAGACWTRAAKHLESAATILGAL